MHPLVTNTFPIPSETLGMIRREFPTERRLFRVRLGHLSLLVQAADAAQAREAARRRWCEELPRLWDALHAADDDRFQVEPAGRAAAEVEIHRP